MTADRDAFAKTKPCVEVFTGYQKWRKRGRKVGLGFNAARKVMKQTKGSPSHCGFFRRNNAGKKRVELSYEQAHSELREQTSFAGAESDDDDGTAGEQRSAPVCNASRARALLPLLLLPGDGRAKGVWERWAEEEKGAHVLTAAVCAGAGRAATDRRRCRCSEGTMMIAAASSWVLVVADRRLSRQKQESRAWRPSVGGA